MSLWQVLQSFCVPLIITTMSSGVKPFHIPDINLLKENSSLVPSMVTAFAQSLCFGGGSSSTVAFSPENIGSKVPSAKALCIVPKDYTYWGFIFIFRSSLCIQPCLQNKFGKNTVMVSMLKLCKIKIILNSEVFTANKQQFPPLRPSVSPYLPDYGISDLTVNT